MFTHSTKKGFTLIELLVVISIISLLSSIVLASLTSARTKALNVTILAQIHQYQNSFELASITNGSVPNPGDTTYYCLGKLSSETCTFFGATFQGNTTITNASIRISTSPAFSPIKIDGLVYNDAVYRCQFVINGVCTGAIYWPQSTGSLCTTGKTVVFGASGGVVCGQNAADGDTTYVDYPQPCLITAPYNCSPAQ